MHNVMNRVWSGVVLLAMAFGTAHAQQMPATAQAWLDALTTVEVVNFSESDVKSLLSAAQDLEAAGLDEIVDDNAPMDALAALEGNSEARGILKSNGYSPEKFSLHMMNFAMAMGAAEMRNNQAEMEATMAQLEMMKGQLPAEQYEAIRKQVVGVQEIFARAPDGNIDLATKYQADFEAIGDD